MPVCQTVNSLVPSVLSGLPERSKHRTIPVIPQPRCSEEPSACAGLDYLAVMTCVEGSEAWAGPRRISWSGRLKENRSRRHTMLMRKQKQSKEKDILWWKKNQLSERFYNYMKLYEINEDYCDFKRQVTELRALKYLIFNLTGYMSKEISDLKGIHFS